MPLKHFDENGDETIVTIVDIGTLIHFDTKVIFDELIVA